jgi:hypothetical protein
MACPRPRSPSACTLADEPEARSALLGRIEPRDHLLVPGQPEGGCDAAPLGGEMHGDHRVDARVDHAGLVHPQRRNLAPGKLGRPAAGAHCAASNARRSGGTHQNLRDEKMLARSHGRSPVGHSRRAGARAVCPCRWYRASSARTCAGLRGFTALQPLIQGYVVAPGWFQEKRARPHRRAGTAVTSAPSGPSCRDGPHPRARRLSARTTRRTSQQGSRAHGDRRPSRRAGRWARGAQNIGVRTRDDHRGSKPRAAGGPHLCHYLPAAVRALLGPAHDKAPALELDSSCARSGGRGGLGASSRRIRHEFERGWVDPCDDLPVRALRS